MKRHSSLIVCLLFTASLRASAQDTLTLRKATGLLDQALVRKDDELIRKLIRKSARYVHSNGWTETRSDMIRNLHDGTLSYTAIREEECHVSAEGGVGVVRSRGIYQVVMGQKSAAYHLKVVQIWKYKRGIWKLVGRTSEQLP